MPSLNLLLRQLTLDCHRLWGVTGDHDLHADDPPALPDNPALAASLALRQALADTYRLQATLRTGTVRIDRSILTSAPESEETPQLTHYWLILTHSRDEHLLDIHPDAWRGFCEDPPAALPVHVVCCGEDETDSIDAGAGRHSAPGDPITGTGLMSSNDNEWMSWAVALWRERNPKTLL